MPSSDTENKHIVKQWYQEINPNITVDIGIGKGTYAKLCKKKPTWIGVEIFAPYVEKYNLHELYDDIIIGDIRYIDLQRITRPDLVIIGDVLEHMEKHQAISVIQHLKEFTDNIIISVPMLHRHQEPKYGNIYETHIDHWSHQEMIQVLDDGLYANKKGRILGYYRWKRKP